IAAPLPAFALRLGLRTGFDSRSLYARLMVPPVVAAAGTGDQDDEDDPKGFQGSVPKCPEAPSAKLRRARAVCQSRCDWICCTRALISSACAVSKSSRLPTPS